jgi:lantibiotic modifying enzyme
MNSKLKTSLTNAVNWLIDIAQVKNNQSIGVHGAKMPITFWNGAIRGEYNVASKKWNCFCPIWHTGQAVKALVMAAETLEKPEWIENAKFSAEFIMQNRVMNGNNKGLILAFEDYTDKVNTSAIMESLDGLFYLAKATGNMQYRDVAINALQWVKNNAWCPEDKLFCDVYDPVLHKFIFEIHGSQGRPLLDDAVFLKAWQLTNDETFKQVIIDTAETLLQNENPPGNWLKYIPCNAQEGNIHPRHAFWWGMPMLDLYKATGDERFYQCFLRSVEWYKKALRKDGGFFRGTYTDFNTDSFGHATSGTACAVISFLKYYDHTGDKSIVGYIEKGLKYCMKMQFTNPEDSNLKGAILEKVFPPDGTDRSPYHIRDLGTIFFIQAASLYLKSGFRA